MNKASDCAVRIVIEEQLAKGGLTWVYLEHFRDIDSCGQRFNCYTSCLSNGGNVFDAWVITCKGDTAFYNQVNYPDLSSAVSQHIGSLVVGGKYSIVNHEVEPNQAPPGYSFN